MKHSFHLLCSGPLSYVSSNDCEETLTLSHLIVGRRLWSLPDELTHSGDAEDSDFELSDEVLQLRVKYLNSVINRFWHRWSCEYLLQLQEAHRCRVTSKNRPLIKTGDVVLLEDKDKPRGFWKLARVEKVLVGRDNKVRGAQARHSVCPKTLYAEATTSSSIPIRGALPC